MRDDVLNGIAGRSGARDEAARFLRPHGLAGVEALHATFVRHRYPPHVHDVWVVAHVDAGAATFEFGDARYTAPARSTFVIPPGVAHTGEPATASGYSYRVLYLEPAVLDERRAPADPSGRSWWPVARDPVLARTLDALHRSLAVPSRALEQAELVEAAASQLRAATGAAGPRAAPAGHAGVRRAREYIDANWEANFTLTDLAAAAGVSRFYLVRLFHEQTGMSPSAYRRALRVQGAQRLLRRGASPVEAALACGFSDQAHLTRTFKAVLGVTPGRYARAG